MPCCGQKRSLAAAVPTNINERPVSRLPLNLVPPRRTVHFQYEGNTGLTVLGAVSRVRYRFAYPGAVVEVDARDAAAMMAVPRLKKISAGADD